MYRVLKCPTPRFAYITTISIYARDLLKVLHLPAMLITVIVIHVNYLTSATRHILVQTWLHTSGTLNTFP